MPDRIVSAAEALREQAAAVELALQGVREQAERAEQRTKQLETVVVPREEHRKQTIKAALVGLAALALVFVASLITIDATKDQISRDVTQCFLRPGALTPAQARGCNAQFSPDDDAYLKVQQRSADATKVFQQLIADNADLKARVDRLEGKPAPARPSAGGTSKKAQ
jgi:hypothetical protein